VSCTSNLDRFGPAIKPTTANSTNEAIPTPVAEALNPPVVMVDNRFINKGQTLALILRELTNLLEKPG